MSDEPFSGVSIVMKKRQKNNNSKYMLEYKRGVCCVLNEGEMLDEGNHCVYVWLYVDVQKRVSQAQLEFFFIAALFAFFCLAFKCIVTFWWMDENDFCEECFLLNIHT